MTDFDNGLPPAGTDVSEYNISSALIATADPVESEEGHIVGAAMETADGEYYDRNIFL